MTDDHPAKAGSRNTMDDCCKQAIQNELDAIVYYLSTIRGTPWKEQYAEGFAKTIKAKTYRRVGTEKSE